jgi:hypothetical protein
MHDDLLIDRDCVLHRQGSDSWCQARGLKVGSSCAQLLPVFPTLENVVCPACEYLVTARTAYAS